MTREEEETATFNEEEMSNNSWVNSERGEFSFETLTIASAVRLFSRTKKADDIVGKIAEERNELKTTHRMTMDEEPKATETHGVKHLNVFQRGIWKAIKNNPQWKTAAQHREFGIRGAIHCLRCAKSTNSQVKALLKCKKRGDGDEDFKSMTDRVNNCLRERQLRRLHEGKESEVSRTAAKQEEVQFLEMHKSDNSSNTIAELGAGGRHMQELAERDGIPKRVPKEWTRQKTNNQDEFEVKACRMSDGEMRKVLRQTTPKRTTRIRGSITVGDWTKTRGLSEEMTGDNAEFAEPDFEEDILLDTGCSYTIVSLAWIIKYCRKHKIDIKSVLIRYPEGYEAPCANTAAEGSSVQGIGFARIKLSLVTLQKGHSLKWNQGGMTDGGGATRVELDTYVHVFENMNHLFC